MSAPAKTRRRKWPLMVAVVVVVGGAAIFWGLRKAHSAPSVPTAVVRRGSFVDSIELHGQVTARQSVVISAPYRAGNLQILKLVSTGKRVKKGDALVQFDATEARQTLAQDRVALKSANAGIQQAQAKARMKEEKDLTAVTKARYNVQSAELDASKQEILSQIEGEEAKLKLADARQQLRSAQAKLKADRASDAASILGKRQVRDQALYQVRQAQRILGQLTLRAPAAGIVTLLRTNWQSPNPMSGPQVFRPGDHVWPGAPIAELPDLATLEGVARVDETERGRLQVGQHAELRFSTIPDHSLAGRVKSISTLASTDFTAGWPFPRDFTVEIAFDKMDPRLRPDMSGTVRVAVNRVAGGILIPSQALFRQGGERIAYVLHGSKFQARRLVVSAESNGQALVARGLQPGERVALKNPTPSP
jgi:HlyD family secretion protein